MNLYQTFLTDPALEKGGVVLNYGDFSITIARAGGANRNFARVLEAKTKPYRRLLQTDMMDNEQSMAILREVYAETVIVGWSGVQGADGQPLEFNKKNVLKVLEDLPDLFLDIQAQAGKVALFRAAVREEEAGN